MTRLAFPLQIQLVNREDLFAFQLLGSHGWVILVSAASWSLLHLVLWVLISVFRSLRPVYLKEASLGECIRSSKFAELRSEIIGAVHAAGECLWRAQCLTGRSDCRVLFLLVVCWSI
jgi:hypothetical protein